MSDIQYSMITELLLERIPELREKYEQELEWWREEQPGPHVIYGDLLNPLIADQLATCADEPLLRRMFSLLEDLSRSEDEKVRDVVGATVLEYLLVEPQKMKKARHYMGPATLEMANQMENWRPQAG